MGKDSSLNRFKYEFKILFAINMPKLTLVGKFDQRCKYGASWIYSPREVKLSGVFINEIVKAVVCNAIKIPVTLSFYNKCQVDAPEIECEENLKSTLPRNLERGKVIRMVPTKH